jgi:hypothetical protein
MTVGFRGATIALDCKFPDFVLAKALTSFMSIWVGTGYAIIVACFVINLTEPRQLHDELRRR